MQVLSIIEDDLLKKAGGRRQEAEGTFSSGIQTPPNCKRRVDGRVLDPSSVRSQVTEMEAAFPSAK
ncbi:hypothetical protein [Nostoc sp. NZL]|uniref:hypothetical protein n=1 Tax=Nostoc sp. NZL TaxID=2650612 RepID=UPI0018C45C1A|nr:hypothetical protein [Nostoc sp. NZL]MBG1245598.1 hypothetical protein [Nostoc sp. NZL]